MALVTSSGAVRINSNDVQLMDVTFGSGEFKQVFPGTWKGQQVAVTKYFNFIDPRERQKLEEVFRRELTIHRCLDHPNIVSLLAFCHLDEQNLNEPKLLVMERMDHNLEQLIRSTKLDLASKVDLMVQISRGMKYLHENGVFHRDLKPSNILVKRVADSNGQTKWECKVTDFGLSKELAHKKSVVNTAGKIGTLLYCSPELYWNQASGVRSDVYSAAMTFFQLLTSRLPYATQQDLERSFKDDSVRPKFKPTDGVPLKLQQLLQRMWNADKSKRPLFDEVIATINSEVVGEMAKSAAGAGGVAAELASGSASSSAASSAWPSQTRPSNVEEWGVQEVVEWLGELGLDDYEHIFIENKITGEYLIELTQEDMKEIGIKAKGDQIKLRKAIELLKRPPTSEAPSTSPQQPQASGLAVSSASQPAPRVIGAKKIEFGNVSSQSCRAIGSEGSKPGQLKYPRGILVDKTTNDLIVSEFGNHRVQELDEDGKYVQLFGNGHGNQPGQLNNPWGITMSNEGRLMVCDSDNNRLQCWRKEDGSYAGLFGVDSNPRCVAIGPSGDQLFVSLASHKIGVISMDGRPIGWIGSGWGSGDGQLHHAVGLAFNSHGDVLVGDSYNMRISVFEGRSGRFKSKFGRFNGYNLHVAVDSFDRTIVSDYGAHRLALFDGGFESIGQFGSEGNQLGQFNHPQGVWMDEKNGRLLVCDQGNHRVQIVSG